MSKSIPTDWSHFQNTFLRYAKPEFSLDYSLVKLPENFFASRADLAKNALKAMSDLEAGAIANPDEKRMVGHYWLRNATLAPTDEIRAQIVADIAEAKAFAKDVHKGRIAPPSEINFTDVLVVGIGGSALGPQLMVDALGTAEDKMAIHFFDNTDPDGMERLIQRLGKKLDQTLCVVISKSGGTPETRNGMLVAKAAYEAAGLDFGKHAVAVTGPGSKMDQYAIANGFMRRFPMQDWVGGRTSIMHTVGLVPMALQGIDLDAFLTGAAEMDALTRSTDIAHNPAMVMALMWHEIGGGKGQKDMVVLPYKDRLVLMSKYLQQLIMESLGKELDLDGKEVNQGIAVYGNKGSTDQHAYVQQLREGVNNFFATFIEVREASKNVSPVEVDPDVTCGDYLQGFLRGTRKALAENGRQSLTISLPNVSPYTVGGLIALFERAVGFYASLVNINAYHQPGVEAGKKAAADFLALLAAVKTALGSQSGSANAAAIAAVVKGDTEAVFHCLNHLVATGKASVSQGRTPAEDSFTAVK
jgi:glucose-6-phosphate isomerase